MSRMLVLYVALAAPLLIAVFLLRQNARRFAAFFVVGLTVCLLSAYINTFLSAAFGMGTAEAAVKLTPISEEVLKALPLFFFVAVFAPRRGSVVPGAMAIGLGFAMMENVSSLLGAEGSDLLIVAVIRGFSAGIMHMVCGAALGYGLALVYKKRYLTVPVSFILLCITITCHAIYNLFVIAGGIWQMAGYMLPIAAAVAILIAVRRPLFAFSADE